MKISVIVDKNIEILKQKIKEHTPGCSTVKIVSIPQIFSCSEDPGKSNSRSCLSTLPGAINMLNLRGNLIIPNTYYRPFNLYIKKQLELLGQKVFFTDDLELYHDGAGEIHCGTNVLREPNKYLRKIGSN